MTNLTEVEAITIYLALRREKKIGIIWLEEGAYFVNRGEIPDYKEKERISVGEFIRMVEVAEYGETAEGDKREVERRSSLL